MGPWSVAGCIETDHLDQSWSEMGRETNFLRSIFNFPLNMPNKRKKSE
jgi:hypothetical protein